MDQTKATDFAILALFGNRHPSDPLERGQDYLFQWKVKLFRVQ